MDEYLWTNRENWNERTPIHARSEFYDLAGFKAGKTSLSSLETSEVGEVAGKSLLHLQCHFGMDTLSWARLGARVTGVDFSEEAIELAGAVSRELGLEARWVCSDVYDLPNTLGGEFDIVYTSGGVLTWLSDVSGWAQIIARYLKPGGTFYIIETHPFLYVFDNERDVNDLKVGYSYFHDSEPLRWAPEGTYADRSAPITTPTYEWMHSLGEIVTSLSAAGLRIEFLHEFPFCGWQYFSFMEQGEDGWWRLRDNDAMLPLTFSLRAVG